MWIEESIKKDGTTVYKYYERYIDKEGKRRRTCITLKDNKKSTARQAVLLLDEKIKRLLYTPSSDDILVSELLEQWLQVHEKKLRYNSLINYQHAIKRLYKVLPTSIKYKNLTPSLLANIYDALAYEKNYSHVSIQMVKVVIMLALEYAFTHNVIGDYSALKAVKVPIKKKANSNEVKYLERHELKEVLERLYVIDKRLASILEFISLTGLRIGEMLALRKCDYDATHQKISINGTVNPTLSSKDNIVRLSPKTDTSYRDVYLSDRAVTLIESLIAGSKIDYICTRSNGTRLYFVNSINYVLKKLNYHKKLSTHIFRHTHISLLSEMNIPIRSIMDRVGHATPAITLQIYTHVTMKAKRDIIEKLNNCPL